MCALLGIKLVSVFPGNGARAAVAGTLTQLCRGEAAGRAASLVVPAVDGPWAV